MASPGTKRCLDCEAPLPAERSFVRCQDCIERNMAAHYASEHAKALAALRPRTTIICVVCGTEKEVWLRARQQPRTCSPKCRQQLYRDRKKAGA